MTEKPNDASNSMLPVLGGVELALGQYLPSGADGLTAQKPSGGYAYYDGETLTLHDFRYIVNLFLLITAYKLLD